MLWDQDALVFNQSFVVSCEVRYELELKFHKVYDVHAYRGDIQDVDA